MKLSVVLPVFSEQQSVIDIVDWLNSNVKKQLYEIIIVISPRSNKKSKKICKDLAKQKKVKLHVQIENPGVGRGYAEGFELVKGTHTLMFDSDGEMDVNTIPKMIKKIESTDCDFVVASRWMKGGGAVGYEGIKYIYNRLFQYVFRIIYLTKIHDLSLGFKLFKTEIVKNITWTAKFNEIGLETTLRPLSKGYKAEEVPTVWTRRQEGRSTNNFWKNFGYLWLGLKIRFSR